MVNAFDLSILPYPLFFIVRRLIMNGLSFFEFGHIVSYSNPVEYDHKNVTDFDDRRISGVTLS